MVGTHDEPPVPVPPVPALLEAIPPTPELLEAVPPVPELLEAIPPTPELLEDVSPAPIPPAPELLEALNELADPFGVVESPHPAKNAVPSATDRKTLVRWTLMTTPPGGRGAVNVAA